MITMNVSGNLTADATAKNINGAEVLNFSIASNRSYTTADGQKKEEVTFINCELWKTNGLAQYFFKGRAVHASGYFKVRTYVGNDGTLKNIFSLRVISFEMFGKNKTQAAPTVQQPTNVTNDPQLNEVVNDFPETDKPTIAEIIDDLPF